MKFTRNVKSSMFLTALAASFGANDAEAMISEAFSFSESAMTLMSGCDMSASMSSRYCTLAFRYGSVDTMPPISNLFRP